jgi:hypothetical protein
MQPTPVPSAATELDDARFTAFDVVALIEPWPEQGLDAGVWGTVIAVHPGLAYEVEFTERDGSTLATLSVPQDKLELVWSEP